MLLYDMNFLYGFSLSLDNFFLWYLMLYFVPRLYPRSGARNTNVLLRGAVFRTFSVNFFTYGFPVGFGINSFFSIFFSEIIHLATGFYYSLVGFLT